MNTVTHMLAGGTIYGSINRKDLPKNMRNALLFASIAGSIVPDIDTVSRLWDTHGMYQMWHRGITHSVFLSPVWAAVIGFICYLLWKVRDRKILYVAFLADLSHIFLDLLNAWGTGALEPLSHGRFSLGTVSFTDFVVPGVMFAGVVISFLKKHWSYRISRGVLLILASYILVQSVQGYMIMQSVKNGYHELVLAASPTPGTFTVIAKKDNTVAILSGSVFKGMSTVQSFVSKDSSDLKPLFDKNPAAKTLYTWSPLVVVIDDEKELGIFDPRFYRNGRSFLHEYIKK